ncbi:hypothetical protein AMS68_007007 [Peltaster fructicola]|uniref:Zn(2)-C6 fungal-type domain-containing protein n=1 Tax=Peltaster fructicola TaxID=286661 RepID=A0A6H0Y4F4_9PEZI|nr:hypothetical protein AMS68_007007 [Peltaster fructicola]
MAVSRSIALACEGCRKKKIKCSGEPAPCIGCDHSKIQCHFSGYVKPRKTPVRSSRRITGLERRLEQIEELLRSNARSTPSSRVEDDRPATILRNIEGHGRSIMSEQLLSTAQPSVEHSGSNGRECLPPMEEAIKMATEYFATTNKVLPLFEESYLMPIFRIEFSTLTSSSGAIWAALNLVLGLNYQYRAASIEHSGSDDQIKAMALLDNACKVIDDFSAARIPCVLTAQVLLAIAEMFRASPTPQRSSMYIALAVRQFYHLGLHRPTSTLWSDELQSSVCFRLFWAAYTIDRDINLRLDQPPMLTEADFVFARPVECSSDVGRVGYIKSRAGTEIAILKQQVDLAVIQDTCYHKLRIARGEYRDDESLKVAGCELAIALESWLDSVGVDFTPESLTNSFSQAEAVALMVMYARYFNTLTTAHRLAYWAVEELENYKSSFENLATDSCPSQAICVKRARQLLQLFPVLPKGNVPAQWYVYVHVTPLFHSQA